MNRRVRIVVKTNSRNNEINWDDNLQAYRMSVKAQPKKNKANEMIVKYLTKTWKKKVRIVSGAKSKIKILEVS